MVAADLDNDGDLDLAAAGYSGNMSLYTNAGDGTFDARTDLVSIPGSSIGAADFDGDGKIDLVVSGASPGGITLLSADQQGVFQPWSNLPAGVYPGNLYIADLDGDGAPDMAVANGESEELTLLWNERGGAFTVACLQPGRGATFVAGGDLDTDSRIDLVITNINRKTMAPIRNLGSRTFLAPSCFIAAKELQSLTAADMDGDGRLDLLVDQTTSMGLHLNDGQGGFNGRNLAIKTFGTIVAEDLNGDGQNDIVSGGNSGELYVSLNAGHALFPTAKTYQTLLKPFLRAADMDGDGHPDLIGLSDSPASVCLLLNDGHGAFAAPTCVRFDIDNEEFSATAADFDGDGDLDVCLQLSVPRRGSARFPGSPAASVRTGQRSPGVERRSGLRLLHPMLTGRE